VNSMGVSSYAGLIVLIISAFIEGSSGEKGTNERPGGSYVYTDTRPSKMGVKPVWDHQGYVFFCLCMGMYDFLTLN
jgi:hypothetical protein